MNISCGYVDEGGTVGIPIAISVDLFLKMPYTIAAGILAILI